MSKYWLGLPWLQLYRECLRRADYVGSQVCTVNLKFVYKVFLDPEWNSMKLLLLISNFDGVLFIKLHCYTCCVTFANCLVSPVYLEYRMRQVSISLNIERLFDACQLLLDFSSHFCFMNCDYTDIYVCFSQFLLILFGVNLLVLIEISGCSKGTEKCWFH